MRVRLLHVPGCPLVETVRATLRECREEAGVAFEVEEVEGAFPSPTVVVDGNDVTTGAPVAGGVRCRLDLPSREQVLAALARSP